jgi:hypothetical protein
MNPTPPPPLPPPAPITSNPTVCPTDRKSRIFSWSSILLAGFGIPPLVIFTLAALDGFGIAVLLFLVIGLVAHASGILLGFLALLSGKKLSGIIGMIGNGMIAVIALLAFMFSLSLNRY